MESTAFGSHEGNPPLVNYLVDLGQQRRVFLSVLIPGLIIATLLTILWPQVYVASTVILPPQQQLSSSASALAQIGALSGVAGGMKTPDDLYVGLLKTRSVLESLIEKNDLSTRYEKSTKFATRKALLERTSVTSDKKTGLVQVDFEDEDPNFAAKIANSYVEELRQILNKVAITEAQQRRVFYSQQVEKTKKLLAEAEVDFRLAQKKTGLVISQALAESGVKESAVLRSQISAKHVQLQVVERFATPQSAEAKRINAELSALSEQLSRIENGDRSLAGGSVDSLLAVQSYRNMKVQEVLLEAFIKQLEMAKFDESKDGPLLQQVDVATPPDKAAKPSKLILFIGISLLWLVVSVVVAIVRQHHINAGGNTHFDKVLRAWRKPKAS
jgi:tyrosine-protein kinase Etk/Wzc